jgi:hypothetical protein
MDKGSFAGDEAALGSGFLPEAAAMPGWYRSLRLVTPLVTQALGHTVRLMPPSYVKPYVKRHKNDATDAEAICEAVTRPSMRFVATKTLEQFPLIVERILHCGSSWRILWA